MPDHRLIACMKWGTRYGPAFANRLYLAVRRQMKSPFRFLCFTDDTTGLLNEIECHPLPPITLPPDIAETPWRKLSLWQSPLAGICDGDLLVLDLDLVITGPMDDFFTYAPGQFCVIENWSQPGKAIGNTSVFRMPIGQHTDIFEQFNADPETVRRHFRIEQQYISTRLPDQKFWPASWCLSFKHSILPRFPLNWVKTPSLPPDARIIAFTGHPDPDEARDGHWPAPWYKKIYKHLRPTAWINDHWTDTP
ncbi:MAG: hypothetical protein AAFO78_07515 [Pseudomonadota bacterium]